MTKHFCGIIVRLSLLNAQVLELLCSEENVFHGVSYDNRLDGRRR